MGFVVKSRALVQWKCIPLLASYCLDFSERKKISSAQRCEKVKRPFITYMVTRKDVFSGEKTSEKLAGFTKMIRSRFVEIARNNIGIFEDTNDVIQ